MYYTFMTADRTTHLKVVAVSLIASIRRCRRSACRPSKLAGYEHSARQLVRLS